VRRDLPSGTVSFLFTDIEGSTKLLHELGPEGYADALASHRRLLRAAFARHGGVEVDTQGDAFFYAFPTADGAVRAASEGQEALRPGPIRVRMGVHTGTPHVGEEGYIGEDVNKGARIAAAGHGGQVLISRETRALVQLEVSDLGEHRVKDFAEPVWIFQLGMERFPPLKTISNTNLPRPASSFVGRQREISEVTTLLRDARLVTLSGPGGSGKTRLAIEAATASIPAHKNGVFWVGLASLRDPAVVVETIAQTLGATDDLAAHIDGREMLLLLDNFEQVVDAAVELTPLIEACPNLRILVTSRELLRVNGEVEYQVPPLARSEAVHLFCARSHLAPDETIADLCRRLDDLPLAVELAAARTSALTPQQIRERLSERLDLLRGGRDADARQATLRATIEWSHDLLSPDEKALFAHLAVFAGGATLATAETVVEAGLDTLQSLVDKSLLRHTVDRFWMLETIREYAIERLAESTGGDARRRRHADHFLALAVEADPHLYGPNPKEWLDRITAEIDNMRAAHGFFEAAGDHQSALLLAGSLTDFWQLKGHIAEGRRLMEGGLAADTSPTAARARALLGVGDLASASGDLTTAKAYDDEALSIYRALEDPRGVANATWRQAYVAVEQRDFDLALRLHEEAIAAFRELGDEHAVVWVTRGLAWAYHERGDLDQALELHERNLARARELGNRPAQANLLGSLASVAADLGRHEDALALLRENHPIYRAMGDFPGVAENLARIAKALTSAGRYEAAARVLSCVEVFSEEVGGTEAWAERMKQETLDAIHAALDDDAFTRAWERGRRMTIDEAAAMALES
jgi:predicted ATPase